jgi:uncharacterized RDD family membrane protein YckC
MGLPCAAASPGTMNGDEVLRSTAGLPRLCGVILYDALLLFSVLFFATAAILPLNAGHAIPPNHPLYQGFLVGISFLYFGWFWTHGGQTLGMRAWRVRLRPMRGESVTWRQAFARYAAAFLSWLPLGLGFWWLSFDPMGCTWHDRLSGTRLVLDRRE